MAGMGEFGRVSAGLMGDWAGWRAACCGLLIGLGLGAVAGAQSTVDLPSSKQLMLPVPGGAQRLNSLPMSLAVSPDGRWVVSLNAGYGTFESGYAQSLAVMDTQTGVVKDFPDARVGENAAQTLFSGLAFGADGAKVYASLASSSAPVGDGGKKSGNGVVVYGFANGVLTPQGFLKLPMVKLADGRHTEYANTDGGTMGIPYPAAIAVVGAKEQLLVAENLSDAVALVDTASGEMLRTFDVSENASVPSTYPIALAATKDGKRRLWRCGMPARWRSWTL